MQTKIIYIYIIFGTANELKISIQKPHLNDSSQKPWFRQKIEFHDILDHFWIKNIYGRFQKSGSMSWIPIFDKITIFAYHHSLNGADFFPHSRVSITEQRTFFVGSNLSVF